MDKNRFNSIIKKTKDETGAALVIEMSVVFPIVVLVIGFLIYMGCYVLQGITMYSDAQRVAVAASRELACPGYDEIYNTYGGVTTTADFNIEEGTSIAAALIKSIVEKHEPYRYLLNNSLSSQEKTNLERDLKKLVTDSAFISSSNISATVDAVPSGVLIKKVKVNVKKSISTPQILQHLGLTNSLDISVTAVAAVSDNTEFVRNTDMVCDLASYMFTDLKINGRTMQEKVGKYKQKFKDVRRRLGI